MIIVVGAEKGGVGKSRLATHICAIAASNSVDVVMLDTDNQGSATSWTRIRNEAGIEPAVSVLSLPPNPVRELANLSSRYALIVVDIGAQNYKTMQECALVSDLVLIPCGNDQQEMESTMNVLMTMQSMDARHSTGKMPAHVVLTRVSPLEGARSVNDLREVFGSAGYSVFDACLPMRAAWQVTGKSGRALHELKGKDRSQKAVDEMQAVYDEIIQKITQGAAK